MKNQMFSIDVIKEIKNALWDITSILRSSMSSSESYSIAGYIACMKALGISSLDEFIHTIHDKGTWIKFLITPDAPSFQIGINMMEKLHRILVKPMSQLGYAIDSFLHKFESNAPFLEAFDCLLQTAYKNEGVYQPSNELVQLGYMLLGNKPGKVLDPFAGIGCFATGNDSYMEFYGAEMANHIKEIGQIRMALAKVSNHASYLNHVEDFKTDRYTSLITMPPFRMKMLSPFDMRETWSELVPFHIYMDEDDIIEDKMVCFVPMTFLSEPRAQSVEIRKHATEGHYIDTIVELPSGLLNTTSIAIAAVLMSTDAHERVRIIDAQNAFVKNEGAGKSLDLDAVALMIENGCDRCFNLSYEEIASNNYSWFMSKELKEEQSKSYPSNYTVRKFAEIATYVQGISDPAVTTAHIATFKSLSKDWTDCMREVDSFPVMDCTERRYHKITEPVLIISNRAELRPTFCNASPENPIMVDNTAVYCYHINEEIFIGYLVKEISSCFIPFESSSIPRITRSYVEQLKIGYPLMDMQQSLFYEMVRSEKLSKARELGLQNVIDAMKTDYINEVRMRKHDMRPHLRQIRSAIDVLEELHRSKGGSTKEEMEATLEGIFSMIPQLQRAMSMLSAAINHLSEEESFGNPELLNISQYISDLEGSHLYGADYDLTTFCDTQAMEDCGLIVCQGQEEAGVLPTFINIARSDLDRLFQNIIENAKTHGYDSTEKKKLSIWIELGVDAERKMFYIEFANDGKPFPEGMTKERYGLPGEKAGARAGTGMGGHIVKKIVQHYGGDYELFTKDELCGVRIYLPCTNHYEN